MLKNEGHRIASCGIPLCDVGPTIPILALMTVCLFDTRIIITLISLLDMFIFLTYFKGLYDLYYTKPFY